MRSKDFSFGFSEDICEFVILERDYEKVRNKLY